MSQPLSIEILHSNNVLYLFISCRTGNLVYRTTNYLVYVVAMELPSDPTQSHVRNRSSMRKQQ
ncbi:TPA: hypothetical protein ACHBAP_000757, partial [Enterococcus faecium]